MSTINIGDITNAKFKVGGNDCSIYLGSTLLYSGGTTPPTPPSVSYAVVDDISLYTATTYTDVYNKADDSWYILNNNNQYEQYGVYGESTGVSETFYEGKLSLVGDYEYLYSGGSWVNLGEVSGNSTTYEITDEDRYEYQGVEMSTTFKIPVADVEALGGYLDFTIYEQGGGRLSISTTRYRHLSPTKNGTVTNDGTYYNYELPDIETITIDYINYRNSTPIHIIVGSTVLPMYYDEKLQPDFYKTYSTVASMESETDVFDGKYGQVGDVIYKYGNGWNTTNDKMMVGTAINGVRSFTFDVNYSSTPNAKAYVNGSSDENGISEWVYQNNSTISSFTFDTSNGIGTTRQLVSYKVNNLDTSTFTTASYFLLTGIYPNLREIDFPATITSITSNAIVFNVTSNNCPIKVNILSQNNIERTNTILDPFVIRNAELYLYHGIKIGNWKPTVPTKMNNLKIYAPSSAITSYRNDDYAKFYIPFITPLDNGECDLSYSYIYSNYVSNAINTYIDFNAIGINDSMTSNAKNHNWMRIMIGPNIQTIYAGALSGGTTSSQRWVQNYKIAEGVKSIYYDAFRRPNEASSISSSTRYIDCQEKRIIEIPDSVNFIGENAFRIDYTSYSSGEEEIIIGSGITEISNYAFYVAYNTGSTLTTKITIKATTPPTLGTNAFYKGDTTFITAIYVPRESVNAYKTATNWSNYASIIQPIT